MKMIGNVSDWLSYAGGALIKVADSAGSTVYALVHIIGQNRPSLTGVRVKPLIFLFMAAILKNGGHLDLFEWLTGFYLILWPD